MSYQKMKNITGPLHVLVIGRVSTIHQPISNIEAGYQYVENATKDIYDGERVVKHLGEQASGMLADRATMLEACDLIEAKWPHVVLVEDLSKFYRNPRLIYAIVQDCMDAEIRVIAPGDHFDTYDENWEVALASAAMRHGIHIPDIRRRIRRTSAKAFPEGGMVFRVRWGWRKLSKEEADSGQLGPKGLRMAKVDDCTPIIHELRERVVNQRRGPTALAEYLNDRGIIPGAYVKGKYWTDTLVISMLRDPLLYGLRQYPKVNYVMLFATGKCKRKKNPDPQRQLIPELAHMTESQWREMNAVLDELGGKAGTSQPSGVANARSGVARHSTVAPLQHATCVICKDFMYGCGASDIKCQNSMSPGPQKCWNHVHVDCEKARGALIKILLERLDRCPGACTVLLDAAWDEIQTCRRRSNRQGDDVNKEIKNLQGQIDNLVEAIEVGGKIKELVARLKTIKEELAKAEKRRAALACADQHEFWPASRDQLQIDPRQALLELARTSFEFSELMRKIFPAIFVQPVQALDCGLVRPRGLLTLDISALSTSGNVQATSVASEEFAVDLFEAPVHIKHMSAVLALRKELKEHGKKATLSILAQGLNINRMTVKRALGYSKLMELEGTIEPYRVLHEPPKSASRWKPRAARSNSNNKAA